MITQSDVASALGFHSAPAERSFGLPLLRMSRSMSKTGYDQLSIAEKESKTQADKAV
jgi:hypothetical protein